MFKSKNKHAEIYQHKVEIFYLRQYRIFRCFALWPAPQDVATKWKILYSIHFWQLLIFWMILLDISLSMQFIIHITSLNEVIKVFFIFATALSVMAKFSTIKLKNDKYLKLFEWMHDAYFLPKNEDEKNLFLKATQLSSRVRDYYTYLSLTALNVVLLTQYIVDKSELPISFYNPIKMNTIWKYRAIYFYQYVSVSILCLTNIGFDSLAASCFIYLKGQLDILAYRLQHIGNFSDDVQQTSVEEQLKDCINYYMRIQQLAKHMEELLSIPISVQILCSVLVLIANFYAMSFLSGSDDLANFIKYLIYQICMLAQIFIICFYANEVSLRSSELSYAAYESNWFHWNKINRRLMLLMMLRFDTPIRIKTINPCYSFNLAAFTSIVNSSYSYFALLKKING